MDNSKQSIGIEGRFNFINIIKFLPLLLLYVCITIVMSSNTFQGDEGRYVMFATNLSNGYYSPRGDVYLWNGPGYPIVLLPFVLLDLPWLTAKLLNPLFLFIAILYFYSTLRLYMKERHALVVAYLLGLYPALSRTMHLLLTEQMSVLLVCGFIFHICMMHKENAKSWFHILMAAFFLGFLALTKIFFGYVILNGIMLFFIPYLFTRKNKFKKTFLVYMFSMLLCVPYLCYTYSISDKVFYWGNSGGLALYLMSSPYEGEFGDWASRNSVHHQKDYRELKGLSNIEKDNALKKKAIENIRKYPKKYIMNWLANIGRLWFNYPQSYSYQKLTNYFHILPNMFLFVLWFLCIYSTIRGWRMIPYEIGVLILFTIISFGGMTPLNGEARYMWPLIPLFVLWTSFVLVRILKIEIRNNVQ